MSSQRILGLLFVALGGALLITTTTDVGGEIVVGALGVGFLVAYVMTRNYGLLVPGAILTGLGVGIVAEAQGAPDGIVPLGLGLGFLAIAVVDRLGTGGAGAAWWWPLIPGGVLTLAGGSNIAGVRDIASYIVPTVLILVGLALLWRPRGLRRRRTTSPPAGASRPGADGRGVN